MTESMTVCSRQDWRSPRNWLPIRKNKLDRQSNSRSGIEEIAKVMKI